MSSVPSLNWKVFTPSSIQKTDKFISYKDRFHAVQMHSTPYIFNVTTKYEEKYVEIF
jgi:hypothetical protein